jgi:4-amino-4-deoxy-L-arabinose transferase-like glycosyltransferase
MMPERWSRDRLFLGVLAGSVLLKLVLAVVVRDDAAILDEAAYLDLAQGLAAGRGFDGTFRPPGYPAFLAFWLWLGAGTLGARLMQVGLSAISTIIVYRLGARAGGIRVARVAAAVFAFDPVLIAFSHRLWSETVFITLLLLAVDLLVRPWEQRSLRRTVAAGVLFGLGALIRPMLVTALPFLALWLLWEAWLARREGAGMQLLGRGLHLGLLTGVMFALILPWTARNQRVTGTFILIDSNGPFNILVGSQPESRFVDKDDLWSERYGVVEGRAYTDLVREDAARAQAGAMRQAKANIAADPTGFLAKCLWEAGHFWTLDSFLLRHLRNDWYGKGVPGWVTPLVTLLAAGFFAILALTGLAGLLTALEFPVLRLGLLLLLQSLFLFGATYALSRYSVPLRPFLAVGAAVLLAGPVTPAERWRALGGAHRLLTVLALVLLSLNWLRDLPLMADLLRNEGAGHRFRMEQAPAPGS